MEVDTTFVDINDSIKETWSKEQLSLKCKMIEEDNLEFRIPTLKDDLGKEGSLRYIGGVDISFIKGDDINACAALVVLELPSFEVVYENLKMVKLSLPYICTFLAFREFPHIAPLFDELKETYPDLYPQVVIVDGNGKLHPRGFGLACHLGVELDIPTIGIGKNFLVMDGLTMQGVKKDCKEKCTAGGQYIPLIGESGETWGAALRATEKSTNPIFVSIGHRISLETAVAIVNYTSQYRIPEPVRQADHRSRDFLRSYESKGE